MNVLKDLAESVKSQEHLLWDIARMRNEFLLFSIVLKSPSITHNFGTTGSIQVGFSAKCTSPNEYFNQIENWKCHMFNFRLISIDRITYCNMFYHSTSFTYNAFCQKEVIIKMLHMFFWYWNWNDWAMFYYYHAKEKHKIIRICEILLIGLRSNYIKQMGKLLKSICVAKHAYHYTQHKGKKGTISPMSDQANSIQISVSLTFCSICLYSCW